MPHKKTEPIFDILNRVIDDPELVEAINLYTEGLDEFVNYGTHILQWELEKNELTHLDLVVISMFRKILELADSISILLKKGAADPCNLLLRNMFEVTISLEYILKQDSQRRALCYDFASYVEQLTYSKRHDPTDTYYKTYQREYKSSQVYNDVPTIPDLKHRIDSLQNWIDRPTNAQIKIEYERLKNLKVKKFPWYTPFSHETNIDLKGNPCLLLTIKDLATHLDKFDLYEILYKSWSKAVHATDTIRGTFIVKNKALNMVSLRQPTEAKAVTNISFRFIELVFQLMAKRHLKEVGDIIFWQKSFNINYTKPIFNRELTFEIPDDK